MNFVFSLFNSESDLKDQINTLNRNLERSELIDCYLQPF